MFDTFPKKDGGRRALVPKVPLGTALMSEVVVKRVNWSDCRRAAESPTGLQWLWVSVGVILTDQVTKHIAKAVLAHHQMLAVPPFARLVLVYNSGIFRGWLAFGGNEQRWPLVIVAVAVAGALLVSMARASNDDRDLLAGMALVLGGAISNAIDRIVFSHVIDFLQISLGSWSTAVFNLADLAIFAGIAVIAGSTWSRDANPRPGAPS